MAAMLACSAIRATVARSCTVTNSAASDRAWSSAPSMARSYATERTKSDKGMQKASTTAPVTTAAMSAILRRILARPRWRRPAILISGLPLVVPAGVRVDEAHAHPVDGSDISGLGRGLAELAA